LTEARLGESQRSQRAAFVGIIAKPFDLQYLIDLVGAAVEALRCHPRFQWAPPGDRRHGDTGVAGLVRLRLSGLKSLGSRK